MTPRSTFAVLLLLALAVTGCSTVPVDATAALMVTPAPGCTGADPVRVRLQPTGDPLPDVSQLVMCTDRVGAFTTITNSGDDTWLAQTPTDVVASPLGDIPDDVAVFRMFSAKVGAGGFFLEPGTSLGIPTAPRNVNLVVDKANQGRWTTYSLLSGAAGEAKERLPDLIKRKTASDAVANCLDAGSSFVTVFAKSQYDTPNLLEHLGLGTKTTQCGSGLLLAEKERQAEAFARTGRTLPELKPVTFARYANKTASYIDRGLQVIGTFAKAV